MQSNDALRALLDQGLAALSLTLTEKQINQLVQYVALLHHWNKAYNLTAIRDAKDMMIRHVLDSLSIVPYVTGDRCLDVGSGPGLPGLILAIALPHTHWVLLDSNGKKTRFLAQAVSELKLSQVEVLQSRVEQYHPEAPFEVITLRAFSQLDDIVAKTAHLLSENGAILAMKGAFPKQELQNVSLHGKVHAINVPFIDEQRHLVCLTGCSRG